MKFGQSLGFVPLNMSFDGRSNLPLQWIFLTQNPRLLNIIILIYFLRMNLFLYTSFQNQKKVPIIFIFLYSLTIPIQKTLFIIRTVQVIIDLLSEDFFLINLPRDHIFYTLHFIDFC